MIGQGNTAWLETFNVRTFTDSAYLHETDAILAMGRAIYVDVSTNNTFKIDSKENQVSPEKKEIRNKHTIYRLYGI